MPRPKIPETDVEVLSSDVVRDLSAARHEPEWMLAFRLASLESLLGPWRAEWARASQGIDLARLLSLSSPARPRTPAAGSGALAVSEAAYGAVRKELEAQGVIFVGLDAAVREVTDLVRRAFGAVVTADDGPYAALNGAVWSGGSFLYVPRGVHVSMPLQAEIREDFARTEPFERNLLAFDEGASAEFIDGCTAPIFTSAAIHASAVEVVAHKDAHVRYTTLQNWSKGVDNVVAKRAHAYDGASVEWLEANLGSRRNVKAPSVHLLGRGAHAEVHTFALAGRGQDQAIGADVVHMASDTSSRIDARAVLRSGGRVTYAPRVSVAPGASRVSSVSEWSALLLDSESRWAARPSVEIDEADAAVAQSGSAEPLHEDALFYVTSRGLPRREAVKLLVAGALEPFARRLPLEYAVEVRRIVDLELEGAVG